LFPKRAAAVLLCFAIVFSFCSCGKKEPKNANKKMTYILTAEPKTLDPQIASDTSALVAINALFEGLVRLDEKGQAYPGVAEKWESNTNSSVFTFSLRKNAKWSDKEKSPVTAGDFVFAFQRALSPQTGSPSSAQLFCIKNAKEVNAGKLPPDKLGVTAKDADTLVVELSYSYPDFPKLTASAAFMPCNAKFFEGTSGRYGLEKTYVIGNGPFAIDGKYGWEHGKFINLVRSATYTGHKKPLPASLKLNIISKASEVPDPVTALTAGSADAMYLPANEVDAAAAAGCTVASFENTTWGLSFQTQSLIMKNVNIRKAFIQALDRDKVLGHLPQAVTRAENIIPPSTTWMGKNFRATANSGSFYLKKDGNAAALLNTGVNELALKKLPPITIICPDNASVKLMLNEMIAQWNAAFHYYFNMEPLSGSELSARIQTGNYEIAISPIEPFSDGPLSVLSHFKSGAQDNPSFLQDASFDAMLTEASKKNGNQAAAAFSAAEKYLNEQAIFYPLYYQKDYFASAKGVTGIVFQSYGGGVDFIRAGKE
jgi:oligopeptide transport system substrate-binding protein